MRIVGNRGKYQHSSCRGDLMRKTALMIAVGFALASCTHNDAGTGNNADGLSSDAINGEAAYNEHCAVCHETGMLGAPREGEPQDWKTRSGLCSKCLRAAANQNCRMRSSMRLQNTCSKRRSRTGPRIRSEIVCSMLDLPSISAGKAAVLLPLTSSHDRLKRTRSGGSFREYPSA